MDKYEFNIKVEQIKKLVNKSDYETAMKIADTIDWRRVRNVNILSMVAGIYEKNGEFQEAKDILLLAFERAPIGKRLLYKLADLALKEGNVEEAEDYYKEFCNLAADDPRQYILRYMILKAKGAPVEQLIHTLEQYCNAELDEKWMYELAELYNQAGMEQLCVMTCDKIMLMFGLGKYVDKAMELKLQYAPLNQYQMDLVENKEKYEAKLKAVEQEYKKGTSIVQPIENTDRRQLDREEEPVEDTAEDETVYAEDEYTEDYREEPAVTIQDDDITEEEPVSEEPEEELAEEPEETYETEEPETEDYEAGESEAEESEEEPEADEEQAVYETAAADEEIRASIHEARAQENLAREMSKLSAAAEEEDLPEDEMGQTRALTNIRELRKGPVYTGSNHLMIEAEVPEKGLALAVEALRKIHKETGAKNQAAKISGEKLNRRGVFALADKLTGKDLIIEQAGDMNESILQELNQLMARDETGMNVVLIDTAKRLEELHRVYPGLAKRFECIGTSDSIKAKKAAAPVKAEAIKTEAVKAETVKTEVKAAEVKAEPEKEAAPAAEAAPKKAPARKAAPKKETAAKKAPAVVTSKAAAPKPAAKPAAQPEKKAAAPAKKRPVQAPAVKEPARMAETEQPEHSEQEMDIDEFAKYACQYASKIDCSISGKSMLALYERIEIMEEDGIALTREEAENLIEEAADRAENPSFFKTSGYSIHIAPNCLVSFDNIKRVSGISSTIS